MRTINGVLKYFSYILKYKWTAKIIIGANTSKKKKNPLFRIDSKIFSHRELRHWLCPP